MLDATNAYVTISTIADESRSVRDIVLPELPGRFDAVGRVSEEPMQELRRLAVVFSKGVEQLHGLYMRICDTIRNGQLTDAQVRECLGQHFPAERVSELLRVAHAPNEVYIRYHCHFFGFRAALRACRGYHTTPDRELRRRKIRRTAERLILLLDGHEEQIEIRGWCVRCNPPPIRTEPSVTLPNAHAKGWLAL